MHEPLTTGEKVETAAFTTLIALSWIVAFVFGVLVGLRAQA